jgi:hypothetical protein
VLEVAEALGWSESKLSRIETAVVGIRSGDLHKLLRFYDVESVESTRLTKLANQSRQRAWWEGYGNALTSPYETYIAFEAEAGSIRNFEAQVVPGLLQTAEYARAVIEADGIYEDPSVLDTRVQVRMARQAVLIRDPQPSLFVVLDEAVLRRSIGGPAVMRRQLVTLAEAGQRPNVTLQVLPFEVGAHRALAGSFIILDFPDGTDPPLVYSEGMSGGVFRTKAEDVRSYRTSFDAVREAAMSPDGSRELIAAVADG